MIQTTFRATAFAVIDETAVPADAGEATGKPGTKGKSPKAGKAPAPKKSGKDGA
jgi:hypothetical protein